MTTYQAAHSLELGTEFPFDASDKWWNGDGSVAEVLPSGWEYNAARGVLADLLDRHTIKHAFENLDENLRATIVEDLAAIIRLAAAAQKS